MNTFAASVVRAWDNWDVRLWPDEVHAEAYIAGLRSGGFHEGLQSAAVLPYSTELPAPAEWPVRSRGFFDEPGHDLLSEELTAAGAGLIELARGMAGGIL